MKLSLFVSFLFFVIVSNGQTLQWAQNYGCVNYQDNASAVLVDDIGNVYVAGNFNDVADFDNSASTLTATSNGLTDAFVVSWTDQVI